MTNSRHAKNNEDGLLYSILCRGDVIHGAMVEHYLKLSMCKIKYVFIPHCFPLIPQSLYSFSNLNCTSAFQYSFIVPTI